MIHLLATESSCKAAGCAGWLCVRLSEALPAIAAGKYPCIYFSGFNTWHSQRCPAPLLSPVRPVLKGLCALLSPPWTQGLCGGCTSWGGTPGLGPTALEMGRRLKVCLEGAKSSLAMYRGSGSCSQVRASQYPEKKPRQDVMLFVAITDIWLIKYSVLVQRQGIIWDLPYLWNSVSLHVSSSEIYTGHCWQPTNEIWGFFCFMGLLLFYVCLVELAMFLFVASAALVEEPIWTQTAACSVIKWKKIWISLSFHGQKLWNLFFVVTFFLAAKT